MKKQGLTPYLSTITVWALAFGCSVGWGAFVMPGTTFLPIAGPLGTTIGMVIGAIVMLIIGANYHYMMNCYPGSGGTFTYTKKTFGYDHGFLSAWFLSLTYIAIIWANVTALSLIARSVIGDIFQFGFHYNLAGYDIYLGEVLVELAVLFACGFLCIHWKRMAGWLQTVLALVLMIGIVAFFVKVVGFDGGSLAKMAPGFRANEKPIFQALSIAALTPWAFIGFESIAHSSEEFQFSLKRSFGILAVAIGTGCMAYTLLNLIAAYARPMQYGSWVSYIDELSTLDGIEGMPVFFGVQEVCGQAGLALLGIVVLAGILTGIIGNTIAVSRLFFSMAEDGILPRWFGQLNENHTPANAIWFIMGISAVIPFFGRTAIGWIVDVTTIGATIAYGYTSAAAFRKAMQEKDGKIVATGVVGVIVSIFFSLFLLVPNLWSVSSLAAESYLILAAWSIIGFLYFRVVFQHDRVRRFGKSTVVWIALLFLIFFTSLMWMRLSTHNKTAEIIKGMNHAGEDMYLEQIRVILLDNSLVQFVLIVVGLFAMFSVYAAMQKRERQLEHEKVQAEESSKAKSSFLSNMSHDIRTPMNAIIGYINLSKREDITPGELKEYLTKIEGSSQYLLALINDVLEMSRIESGKMELEEVETDLKHVMEMVYDMFVTQMHEKHIHFTVDYGDISDSYVLCDRNRLNRVLLNLISNAYKFTPESGSVSVVLKELSQQEDRGNYELRVKDSGIGMSEEFAAKVFEAFERERNSTVSGIQGTGLGMAITKSLVDLMGGTIQVITAQGKGTEFVVRVSFKLSELEHVPEEVEEKEHHRQELDYSKIRLLLVEDMEVNREIATMLLQSIGFMVETAFDGKEAVNKVQASHPGYYDAVLMDIQMPVMDGYEATSAIRELENEELSKIPIVAMTANAFEEDVRKAHEVGMNSHVAKPIDINVLMETLNEIL